MFKTTIITQKVLLIAAWCLGSLALFAANPVFDGTMSLNVAGVNRTMVVHVPANIEANRPLMISLHGRWGCGNDQKQTARFETIADTARFIVVYPDGLPQAIIGGNTGWDASGATDDDITLFKMIINAMYNSYKIDKSRVYLSGFSLGGMETYHAANVSANTFAAFASVAGYPINEYHRYFTGSRPVPFLHIHGKNDWFVRVDTVPMVVDNWVMRNGCNPIPTITTQTGVYTKSVYAAANNGFQYIYYALDGRGHEYTITDTFNPSLEIWKFVRQYKLNDACDSTLKWSPNIQMQNNGTIPVGWTTSTDGVTINGAQTVSTGSRIVALGSGSDAPFGFLIKGGGSSSYLTFGLDKQRCLQLQPGRYKIKLDAIANTAAGIGGTITLQLINRINSSNSYSYTLQPTKSIQNGVASGFTHGEFVVTTSSYGDYQLKLSIAGGTADMVITNLGVYSSTESKTALEPVYDSKIATNELVNIYNISGSMVSNNKIFSDSFSALKKGAYIVVACNNRRVMKIMKMKNDE